MNWKIEKRLYKITEISKAHKEEYNMVATGEEISKWCKMKNDFYGYVPGVGGDRSYACVAVLLTY